MKKLITASIFLVILFLFLIFLFFEWGATKSTVIVSNLSQEFEIKEGENIKSIGKRLEENNLIQSRYFFYYYLFKNKLTKKIQSGKYEFSPQLRISEIIRKMVVGEVKKEIIKITIPEGFTNKKIIERLKTIRPELADDFEFLITCHCLNQISCNCDRFSAQYEFLKKLPKGTDLEGYLFPDTYFIEKNESAETLLQKFLNNFQNQTRSLREEAKEQKKDFNEIVTLASIVEKEVRSDEDRSLVAGIFWQRLNDQHPLQSCAALAYILGIDKKQYSLEDTRIKSPYNTYQNVGLPPGPVCNPGISLIRAALYPQKSDYYFFLSEPETGKTIFSSTGSEHAKNKEKYGL